MKKISVCMAVFNGEKYIQEQISSILEQLSPCDELIVSDDCSIDKTLDIVRSFGDDRIKIVFNELDRGYSGNFENAINKSSGDIIFLSDQDDVWMEGKVSRMVDVLMSCDLVVCNAEYVDEYLSPLRQTLFNLRGARKGFWSNLLKLRYLGACMAFRREIFKKVLPFPKNRALCPHDMWIALVGEFYFKVKTISTPLILYRRHAENVSSGGYKENNGLLLMMQFRLYALLLLFGRLFK